MAKYVDADCRRCRREGCKLFLKGERCLSSKCALERYPLPPGQQSTRRNSKPKGYLIQLREKQKVKRYYGLLEKQFHNYYLKAEQMKGVTGENMLGLLERRLDNVVYRMGIASSRSESRQFVNHGHVTVNGKNVNIPSFIVSVGDVIGIKENKQTLEMFKQLKGAKIVTPKWVEFDTEKLEGKIIALPQRDDIDLPIQEHLIIELYSK